MRSARQFIASCLFGPLRRHPLSFHASLSNSRIHHTLRAEHGSESSSITATLCKRICRRENTSKNTYVSEHCLIITIHWKLGLCDSCFMYIYVYMRTDKSQRFIFKKNLVNFFYFRLCVCGLWSISKSFPFFLLSILVSAVIQRDCGISERSIHVVTWLDVLFGCSVQTKHIRIWQTEKKREKKKSRNRSELVLLVGLDSEHKLNEVCYRLLDFKQSTLWFDDWLLDLF